MFSVSNSLAQLFARRAACVFSALGLFASTALANPNGIPPEPQINAQGDIVQKIIHRRDPDELNKRGKALPPRVGSAGALSTIDWHGGAIMPIVNTYVIWYGDWSSTKCSGYGGTCQDIIKDALYGLSTDNGYTGITTGNAGQYSDNSSYVRGFSSAAVYSVSDNYSQGKTLTDSAVRKVVVNAISKGFSGPTGKNPDASGVYLVLTSSDVKESSGFCSRYCGWHTYTNLLVNGSYTVVKYAFIGNPQNCLSACAAQSVGPNGNAGADAMISVIAHELEEAATDPQLNAWYDSSGAENADKCAWTFGSTLTLLSNNSYYNVALDTGRTLSDGTHIFRKYLIQRALAPIDSKCYVNYVLGVQ